MGPAKSARASLTPPPSRAGMVLVNRLPGASTSMSAASIDSMTPGGAGIPAGSTETSETCFPTSWTTDSPRVTVPSAKRTTSVRLSVAAGKTRPLILKNRAACSTPSQNPPAISASAAIIMLPTLWSFRSPGASKRYSKTSANLRRPASATRQFLTSPGGATPSSWRSRPLEPPSSATVTTAVSSPTLSLKPLSSTGSPVPPPNATNLMFSTPCTETEYTVPGYKVSGVRLQVLRITNCPAISCTRVTSLLSSRSGAFPLHSIEHPPRLEPGLVELDRRCKNGDSHRLTVDVLKDDEPDLVGLA